MVADWRFCYFSAANHDLSDSELFTFRIITESFTFHLNTFLLGKFTMLSVAYLWDNLHVVKIPQECDAFFFVS